METALTRFRQHPVMRWQLNPQRIPLLFAVTIISGIFYHYAPRFTVVWIVLSLLLIGGLFRLFDYVKQHNFIGGILYCISGLAFLLAAREFWTIGYDAPFFGPQDLNYQISFFVWFLTPQSVLQTEYPGFTIALFLLFTFFIASITYYFTLVRYRVLMSFMVMIFPFAIYAKENETMPVVSPLWSIVNRHTEKAARSCRSMSRMRRAGWRCRRRNPRLSGRCRNFWTESLSGQPAFS